MARAENIPVEIVLVADDIALADSVEHAGRRGLAGTILVHKVAGAAAEAGASLAKVAAEAREAAAAVRTMGVAPSACTVPAAGRPTFSLGEDEIELGLGIHGEPGVQRGPMEPADALVGRLLDVILAEQTSVPGGRAMLLVNNFGGTSMMELGIVTRRAVAVLGNRGLVIERVYLGTFLSALEMAGVSLSVLPVDEQRLARLDASTEAPAWSGTTVRPRSQKPSLPEPLPAPATTPTPTRPHTWLGEAIEAAIQSGAKALIGEGPRLTKMDQMVGDGDLGISLERGARAALQALPSLPVDDPAATLHALRVTLQRALGGTSGPHYAVFFLRSTGFLHRGDPKNPNTLAEAFQAGCSAIAELGGPARGDRTMLDTLLPAAEAFQETVHSGRSASDALWAAAAAASVGAWVTTDMLPRRGRSSYLGSPRRRTCRSRGRGGRGMAGRPGSCQRRVRQILNGSVLANAFSSPGMMYHLRRRPA